VGFAPHLHSMKKKNQSESSHELFYVLEDHTKAPLDGTDGIFSFVRPYCSPSGFTPCYLWLQKTRLLWQLWNPKNSLQGFFSAFIPKNLRHRLGCDYQMVSRWMHRLKFVFFAVKQGN